MFEEILNKIYFEFLPFSLSSLKTTVSVSS